MKARPSGITELEHTVSGEKLSLLAVFAHPEDEAFGPSGTLSKYAGEGVRVSLVTAERELAVLINHRSSDPNLVMLGGSRVPRDMTCTCRIAGVQRVCLDETQSRVHAARIELMEERLVRLIRETRPQVIVTYGPQGLSGDSEQMLVHELATKCFELAGQNDAFPQHTFDGVSPYQPLKLYYSVLPDSMIEQWGLSGLSGVPDAQITTVLDVSPYSESKLKAVYCQRHHVMDYTRFLETGEGMQWNEEHFILAASHLGKRSKKEKDLFAGLR